jgi:uncharacterized membrane protein
MLAAGALLFVAAHWEELAPAGRMSLLVGLMIALHLGGALVTGRFAALASTLHAVGTATLGATVFLAGQTYHLETRWPEGFLLWALGAWAGWWLLRDWPQAAFAAVLTPAWLVAEWTARAEALGGVLPAAPLAGLLLLALVYLHAPTRGAVARPPARAALAIIGGIALLPLAVMFRGVLSHFSAPANSAVPVGFRALAWALAIGLPLLLAALLRGRAVWLAALASGWVVAGVALGRQPGALAYLWGGLGAVGVAGSGVLEGSRLRINLGTSGFALTVVIFYFSSVFDRLGRAASLLAGGVLFLGIGWGLERLRRRLVAQVEAEHA